MGNFFISELIMNEVSGKSENLTLKKKDKELPGRNSRFRFVLRMGTPMSYVQKMKTHTSCKAKVFFKATGKEFIFEAKLILIQQVNPS